MIRLLALAALSASAAPNDGVVPSTAAAVAVSTAGPALRLVPPGEWPSFKDELNKKSLLKAAARSLAYLDGALPDRKFVKIGDKEVALGELKATVEGLAQVVSESKTPEELEARVREGFDLYQSVGSDGNGRVVFSSYYQPVLSASLARSGKYRYPLYKKPPDMVDVDLGLFNPKYKGESILGRVAKDKKVVPYFDRYDIDVRRVLAGKGLELAWLSNQFDRLDLHIQGSGILQFPSGRKALAKFAATNALPYKSVGLAVVGSGAMSKSDITYDRLRRYLTAHPEGEAWLLSQNPRYTFFDLKPLPPDGEPFGTIQEPLTPGRSIAIDPKVIPLGAVAYFAAPMPQADKKGNLLGVFPTSRLAFCQDTGGAILGPGRVDIYIGSGPQAKTSAVNQWSEGRLYVLLKKIPERDR